MSKVITFNRTGGPEVLEFVDVQVPAPTAGEVQIRVHAIGINRAEIMYRNGQYVIEPEFPARLGYEAAGVVQAVGENVDEFTIGDLVSVIPSFMFNEYGMYGEVVNAPVHAIVKHPENLGLGEAAKRNVGTGSGQIPDMSSFSGSIASKGYQKLPGGLIIQWGAGDAGTGYVGSTGNEMNFPIAFPSQCFQVVTSYENGGGKIVAGAAGNMTRTGFLLRCDASGGNYNFRWFAIGC